MPSSQLDQNSQGSTFFGLSLAPMVGPDPKFPGPIKGKSHVAVTSLTHLAKVL